MKHTAAKSPNKSANLPKLVPYDVSGAYETLIEKFRDFSVSSDLGNILSDEPIINSFVTTDMERVAEFNCKLYLKNFPWRSSTNRKETVDILVHARETIDISDKNKRVLLKSNVSVNHFKINDTNAQLLQSVRYDYQAQPQDSQHPLFHAQTAKETIVPDGDLELEFNYSVQADSYCCFPYARIPTSDMTLSSVLLSLAADHWPKEIFKEFLGAFEELQKRLPQPNLDVMKANLRLQPTTVHLKCSHWYLVK